MVAMGPIEFSPAEVALVLGMLAGLGVLLALPATGVLAYVGMRRATRYPGWNAFWYWGWGTAVALVVMGGLAGTSLGWWVVPVGWVPVLVLAVVLYPRPGDPGGELGWGDIPSWQQGER
jgi:hypothetical protein